MTDYKGNVWTTMEWKVFNSNANGKTYQDGKTYQEDAFLIAQKDADTRTKMIEYNYTLQEEKQKEMKQFKLVLVGDTTTGKTNFTRELYGLKKRDKHAPTMGVEVLPYVPNNHTNICFNIWDTAGDVNYMGDFYYGNYTHANACLVFCDIMKRTSVQAVEKWIRNVKRVCDRKEMVFAIVCNRSSTYIDYMQYTSEPEMVKYINEWQSLGYKVFTNDTINTTKIINHLVDKLSPRDAIDF